MEELYKKIDALLAERGISGAKLSRDLGMSRSFMTELRKGRAKSVTVETARKLADYFGVSVEYLLGGGDEGGGNILTFRSEARELVNGDKELTEYLEELRRRPEQRLLFSVTKHATKAQIEAIVKMVEEMQQGQ